ncbi:aminotransferase class I/II-fold pyridoxal phosphate-dependent enzyme [Cohnella sp. CFH 77786]|uniref:aminotransferase class I/II-fold pyridoxal phosphate-dependent enzyme n=1 Tax=Cohnella sp. CFH 77786 TaxID=2662265 RepID=UPI001C609803|nr:aminotransferase class I/II-fold pyridoxal phosphate-dependent enzyme [Cohnella sp. CFH 77786]MBW5445358.1 aminotransferase class I/II-fold pyridoxal phosphate-dependent enzyme [Cohnella sp. CFH 77786]
MKNKLDTAASKRLKRLPLPIFPALASTADRLERQGCDVIRLGQGIPDMPPPPHVIQALQASAAKQQDGWPLAPGKRELREAICRWYRSEQGVDLDPETEVAVLPGFRSGWVQLAAALLGPGDAVLAPDPASPSFAPGIALAGASSVPMPLLADNAYLPELGKISRNQRERAKLMLLGYPANPAAVLAPASFFDEAIRFAEDNKILIVHDFSYGAIGFDGKKPVSFLSRPGAKETGIELYSLSYAYNMAGWRIGFALGNRKAIRLLNTLQAHAGLGVFGAVQDAAIAALTSSQECVRELADLYESRRNALFRDMGRIGWSAAPCEGTCYVWVKTPPGFSSTRFADLVLRKAQVMTVPGSGFGGCGEGYVRLGLLTSEERLREAMRRIQTLSLF